MVAETAAVGERFIDRRGAVYTVLAVVNRRNGYDLFCETAQEIPWTFNREGYSEIGSIKLVGKLV